MNTKQYLRLIKGFFNSHAQINTVKSGNQFRFNSKSDIIYPVAHIEILDQNVNETDGTRPFLVTIADIFDSNLEDSEEDIYSDSFEIAEDALTFFGNQIQTDYTFNEVARLVKFNNGHTDKVCGCTFILSFSNFRESNACAIPTK